jgi:hypothetical protein
MDITANELKKLTQDYFSSVTNDKLEKDCERANIDFYNTIKEQIFSEYSILFSYYVDNVGDGFLPLLNKKKLTDKGFINYLSINNFTYADDFVYSLAA